MAEYTILWFLFLSACVLTRYYIDWVTDRTVGLSANTLTLTGYSQQVHVVTDTWKFDRGFTRILRDDADSEH